MERFSFQLVKKAYMFASVSVVNTQLTIEIDILCKVKCKHVLRLNGI